jgi:hypothetical protein
MTAGSLAPSATAVWCFCHGASDDRTMRLCDLVDGRCMLTVPVHHKALAVAMMDDSLAVGLRGGVLVIDLAPGQLAMLVTGRSGFLFLRELDSLAFLAGFFLGPAADGLLGEVDGELVGGCSGPV